MQLLLPKQHGAWAMLIIPFWLGVAASGFVWQHIPFFIGWFFLYLATYPLLLLFKRKKVEIYSKWTVIYMIPALLFLLFPLVTKPTIILFGLVMIPFFLINGYFSFKNIERALANDLIAIFLFSIVGLASSYLAHGVILNIELKVFISTMLFFIGSTFYVKTMIREKKSQTYKWVSFVYHALVPIVMIAAGEWLVAIAFLPSLFRGVYFYGKRYSAKKVGILEIVNASFFFIVMLIDIL